MFMRKRKEAREGGRKLYNKEHHNLNCSPNMISMVNSKRMRSTHKRKFSYENSKKRGHKETLIVGSGIILKRILKEWDGLIWT